MITVWKYRIEWAHKGFPLYTGYSERIFDAKDYGEALLFLKQEHFRLAKGRGVKFMTETSLSKFFIPNIDESAAGVGGTFFWWRHDKGDFEKAWKEAWKQRTPNA